MLLQRGITLIVENAAFLHNILYRMGKMVWSALF